MFATLPVLIFPNIDPVAISLGPLDIRWYSLAYIGGIFFGVYWSKRLIRFFPFQISSETVTNTITWLIIGVIIGGRLGFVLLYQPEYYLSAPMEIFKVWKGGMSFHGGFIGALVSLAVYAKRQRLPASVFFDMLGSSGTIGIALGRLANFINGELWGRPTTLPWGMIFPHADQQARHPSQIYEFLFEGLFVFFIVNIAVFRHRLLLYPYATIGLSLTIYSFVRFMIEYIRAPERMITVANVTLTFGQFYSVVSFTIGVLCMVYAYRHGPYSSR